MEDTIPYIERLGDYWGELCASEGLAAAWADNLIGELRNSWEDRNAGQVIFPRHASLSFQRCWRRGIIRNSWIFSEKRLSSGGNTGAGVFARW
jgi:hypothetical protein